MTNIYKVHFTNPRQIQRVEENTLKLYENFENYMYHEKIEECETCGEDTKDLELIGTLARCKDCQESFEKLQKRANDYMYEPYNSYDNDYED